MKITNKYGVPDNLVTLASREYYTKGKSQYSVTELLSPPRVKRLREKHIFWGLDPENPRAEIRVEPLQKKAPMSPGAKGERAGDKPAGEV